MASAASSEDRKVGPYGAPSAAPWRGDTGRDAAPWRGDSGRDAGGDVLPGAGKTSGSLAGGAGGGPAEGGAGARGGVSAEAAGAATAPGSGSGGHAMWLLGPLCLLLSSAAESQLLPGNNFTNECNIPGNFMCGNGRCIPGAWQCDGLPDCFDKSDEKECPKAKSKCGPTFFPCASGVHCIIGRFRCNGFEDCPDGSDEENCNSHLLSTISVPDTTQDAAGMTEMGQTQTLTSLSLYSTANPLLCSTARYHCRNGLCIDKSFLCDGQNNCQDNSDEESCESSQEPAAIFFTGITAPFAAQAEFVMVGAGLIARVMNPCQSDHTQGAKQADSSVAVPVRKSPGHRWNKVDIPEEVTLAEA
uniref:uncharacterized protein LOC143389872 n=1 Tax=Callospermophilus lateralis TaxID=76772 RepID=UPI004038EE7E